MSGPAVSQLLAALVDAGLVEREASAEDRRRQTLSLSTRASGRCSTAQGDAARAARQLLADLPRPEVDALARLLPFVEAALSGTAPPRRPPPPRPRHGPAPASPGPLTEPLRSRPHGHRVALPVPRAPGRSGGLRAGRGADHVRGDRRAPRHGDPARPARGRHPPAARARALRSARHHPLDAAPRDHDADPERPPRLAARPRRRHVRRRRAADGRGAGGDRARGPLARPARLPDRDRGRRRAARRRARQAGGAGADAGAGRRDGRHARGLHRPTGTRTSSSTSASPRPPSRSASSRR